MASLTSRSDSPYWIACFSDANGRNLKRSTKVLRSPLPGDEVKPSDLKRQALDMAYEYEKAARTRRTAAQVRTVIADLHEAITAETVESRSMRAVAKTWLERKKPEVATSTFAFYAQACKEWLAWLRLRADAPVESMTRDEVTRYRNAMATRLHPTSTNHHLMVIKALFRDARRNGFLLTDPAEFVDPVKRAVHDAGSCRRAFTHEELGRLLSVCPPQWRSMLMFGLYTGQRMADLRALRWSQVGERSIAFVQAKTQRPVIVPIAPPLAAHLATLDRSTVFVHPALSGLTTSAASAQFVDILHAAGLRAHKSSHRSRGVGRSASRALDPLSFHSLRHTAVTLLKEAGVPAAVVMEIVGHSSVAVSRLYTHIGEDVLAGALDKMPAISQLPPPIPPL